MVALKLNLSATIIGFLLAIPVLSAPSGDVSARSPAVEGIIPKEYINQVRAYHEGLAHAKARAEWKHAKRALSVLQKRVPVNQLCHENDSWLLRECRSDTSPQAYQDECLDQGGNEYTQPGSCPDNTVCVEIQTPHGNDAQTGEPIFTLDILCQPSTPPRQDVVSTKRQYGYRKYEASSSKTADISIEILVDNSSSTVSADMLSK